MTTMLAVLSMMFDDNDRSDDHVGQLAEINAIAADVQWRNTDRD